MFKLLLAFTLALTFNLNLIAAQPVEQKTVCTEKPKQGFRNCSCTSTENPATTSSDADCDGFPDDRDNCPNIYNPNQADTNRNGKGNVCDFEWQKTQRETLRRNLEGEIKETPATLNAIPNFGSCLVDTNSNATPIAECIGKENDKKWEALAKALTNKQLISVLEEPISNENIFNRAQICDTKYLKDANGYPQFANPSSDLSQPLNFDEDPFPIPDLKIPPNGKQDVTIGIASCYNVYTEKCTPQYTTIRTVEYGQNLPKIISCSQVQLLFADSGADLLKQYVGLIYRFATGIIGVFAVLVIMINGILISIAGDDESKVTAAKGRIIQSLTALAILFLSGILLYSINPNFFTTSDLQYELKEPPAKAEPAAAPAAAPAATALPAAETSKSSLNT